MSKNRFFTIITLALASLFTFVTGQYLTQLSPIIDLVPIGSTGTMHILYILVFTVVPYAIIGTLIGCLNIVQKKLLLLPLLLPATAPLFFIGPSTISNFEIVSIIFSKIFIPSLSFHAGLWISTIIKKYIPKTIATPQTPTPNTNNPFKHAFIQINILLAIIGLVILIGLNIDSLLPFYISGMETLPYLFIGLPAIWLFWNKITTRAEKLLFFCGMLPFIGRIATFIGLFNIRIFFDPIGYLFDMLGLILTFGDQGSQIFEGAIATIIWIIILFAPSYVYMALGYIFLKLKPFKDPANRSFGNQ